MANTTFLHQRSHSKCCSAQEVWYCNDPKMKVRRCPVPEHKIPWDVEFKDYKPVDFTVEKIVKNPPQWADPDIRKTNGHVIMRFNEVDGPVDRRSYTGKYKVENGLPLNPVGRTGLTGRGRLGRWGPNHAADSIVTRWKMEKGTIKIDKNSRKPVLEFVAIVRRDNQDYAIPGGMVDAGENISLTFKREFSEEALNSLALSLEKKKQIAKQVDKLFSRGVEIYKGYVDDPRNTDNAWMETAAYHFHDSDGSSVGAFRLDCGDDAVGVKWLQVDQSLNLYAIHREFIEKVADRLHAHWRAVGPLQNMPLTHRKCCSNDNERFYCDDPKMNAHRCPVPESKIPWAVEFKDYNPTDFTVEKILHNPPNWADPDIRQINCTVKLKFNELDGDVDRRSYTGEYKVENGIPINPVGRTGMTGRGRLGRWGPNHAADSLVTRWKMEGSHIKCDTITKKRLLEFIAIERRDSKECAIPGGMVDPGEHIAVTLKREFSEEALNSLAASADQKKQIMNHVDKFFNEGGVEIYKGYVDDPRNTDNAWMETEVYHFHDDNGSSVGSFNLAAGDDATGVRWLTMHRGLSLYASHRDFVENAAKRLDAHW